MKRRSPELRIRKGRLWIFPALVAMVVGFQNCSRVNMAQKLPPADEQQMSGNSTGYEGKLTLYRHFDEVRPCTEKDVIGRALPNAVVGVDSAKQAYLLRESCADSAPKKLAAGELAFEGPDHFVYRQTRFESYVPDAMQIARAGCPSGQTEIAGAPRINLMPSSVDLLSADWGPQAGIRVSFAGLFMSLPAFQIMREPPAVQEEIDWANYVTLDGATAYSLSFLAKTGSSDRVRLSLFDGPVDAAIVWSAGTGAVLQARTTGLRNTSFASRPAQDGFLYTFFFTTANATRGLDIGISPQTVAPGDHILATGFQVERLDSYCRP